MNKQKREEKIKFAEAAKAQKVIEVEGSNTSFEASKIGRDTKTTMKSPKRKKDPAKEFEFNSDGYQDYIDFLITYEEGDEQV